MEILIICFLWIYVSFINELVYVYVLRWMGFVDSFDLLIVGNLLKLCKLLNYLYIVKKKLKVVEVLN